MMQLLCNGRVLDLYENTSLQFKHDNPLFAFDKISCERTISFKIPATPTNDRVLELARVPAYAGTGMRKKFTCQLQAGTVVKDGYLYVTNFDGKDYNAIFVTGELVGLQRIKDLGKLSEIMEYTETILASYSVKPANDATFKTAVFDAFRYFGEAGVTDYPSVNIGLLIDKICAHIGVQCATPAKAYEMRLAPASLAVPDKIEGAHVKSERTEGDPYNTVFADLLAHGIIETRTLVAQRTVVWHNGYSPTGEVLDTATVETNVQHFRTLNDIAITFPKDFSDDYFLCYMNPSVSGQCVFLGDYSFTRPTPTQATQETAVVRSGEPLAGRTVEIPAGTSFILVQEKGAGQTNDYLCNSVQTIWGDDAIPAVAVTRGWDFANGLQYDFTVDVDFNDENVQIYRLQDNLPDITFVELLKAVAAELGLALQYQDDNGITFASINIDTFTVQEINAITKRGEVQRVFSDYAQRSVVRYKDDAAFLDQYATPEAYIIENDNIESEKDLQVLPWTNGMQYVGSDGVTVYDRTGRKEFLELRYNAGGTDALRAFISKNEGIQRLCDASTQIKIESRMPLMTYDGIKPDTALLVDNSTYLWTSRSWQKDVVKMTLAQFGKAIVPPEPQPVVFIDWIKSSGSAINNSGWIDTDLIDNTTDYEIEAKIYFENVLGPVFPCITQAVATGFNRSFMFSFSRGYQNLVCCQNNVYINEAEALGISYPYGDYYICRFKRTSNALLTSVNGNVYTLSRTTTPSGNPIRLLCGGSTNAQDGGMVYKTYYIKIWQNGVLVGDYRPAIDNATNENCMYDMVSERVFLNSPNAPGTLLGGND